MSATLHFPVFYTNLSPLALSKRVLDAALAAVPLPTVSRHNSGYVRAADPPSPLDVPGPTCEKWQLAAILL